MQSVKITDNIIIRNNCICVHVAEDFIYDFIYDASNKRPGLVLVSRARLHFIATCESSSV